MQRMKMQQNSAMSSELSDCTALANVYTKPAVTVYTKQAAYTQAPQELSEPLRKFLRPPIAIYRRAAEDIERMCTESELNQMTDYV